ncbi:storkhead-box protein 1 isoform X2 [Anthonomus grandis grandis]|nr:storkhead-box protein 1 isoform X2 [Anthonomus grandis grandis]XP_050306818.1 storkhead-box protein 1 isoform X2 [Anthonomus grandis grandis]XP_050306819.1 storkhead-box protein 1 isoform X2 [Anthonomus grandis grandis]
MTSSRQAGGQDGGTSSCRVKLNHVLAIVVRKEGCQGDPGDFWMYENGYLLFQGLLSSNSVCWWNNALNGATKSLVYYGYVNPGALLVGSEPCAIEVLRNAWARRVLQPPPGYQIVALEDIEHCTANPVPQTQWTPLPEAVCAVVLRLSSQGRPAGIETIREALIIAFPHVSPPSEQTLYDTLVQLTKERKLYNTSSGYYIVTPERKRSRSQSRTRQRRDQENGLEFASQSNKTMLMSTEEAMAMVHGDMTTVRDGNVTHQCIQTNLADVICGGNSSDKILYPRTKRRTTSFPTHRSPEGRGSFRLWSSNRRLRRSASTRTIHKHYVDTSSSTDYPNSGDSTPTPKKESLLSRIFRRSKRSQCQIGTFSAQFPPSEWFNSKAVHLHSVGTQTFAEKDSGIDISAYLETCDISSGSATLPRHHHRRQPSSDVTLPTSYSGSRENSPVSRFGKSPYASSTLPRKLAVRSRDSSRKASRSSIGKSSSAETKSETKHEKKENDVASPRLNGDRQCESAGSNSPVKNLSSIDNSGPSSIESHKSSRTGSSLTSGPSSLESHKTVINRQTVSSPKADSAIKCQTKKEVTRTKISAKTNGSSMSHSNSFTLEVTTNQNGVTVGNGNATATATINTGSPSGANTKIYVQNSPVRSVITFENGQSDLTKPKVVVINGKEETPTKNTNKESQMTKEDNGESETMNNSRKLSLQLPAKDSLQNLIKNVSQSSHNQYISSSNPDSPVANSFRDFSKNSTIYNSNPSSPTKSYEGIPLGKFFKNDVGTKSKVADKNFIGSEPNICYKDVPLTPRENPKKEFPSLSDLSFNFTSLAAQKILKGVSINSVDTLVELNMAANNIDKPNNCEVVHTDFGLF